MKNKIYLKFLVLFVLGFLCLQVRAQTQDVKDSASVVKGSKSNEVLNQTEQMPDFPGGVDKMYEYLSSNVVYPMEARKKKKQGKVVLTFVVTQSGEITDIMSVNEPIGYGIEEEAIRVVKAMPRWNPGMINGKPVTVKFTLPIRFALN
jgi:TonB family protein